VSLAKPPVAARPRAPRPRPRAGTASAETASDPAPAGQSPADPEYRPLDLSRLLESSRRKLSTEPDAKAPAKQTGRSPAVLRRLLRIAVLVGIAAGAALLLRAFVVAPYYIPSGSMEPTLHGCANCNDDHILIDKISYRFHPPQQSDIVVFAAPPGAGLPDKVLVKRVVGLPGQHLALRHGYVYINGKRLEEPYLNRAFLRKECGPGGPSTPETGRSRWTIPSGDVFVMGDNRCNSTDSRAFGPIPDSSIIGRAFAIIWPLGRIRLL
jgi:signal peptidase I